MSLRPHTSLDDLPGEVFVDTSALYAALNRTDAGHERVAPVLEALLASQATLVTTGFVLIETASLLQTRVGFEAARQFMLNMVPALDVAWVDGDLCARGVEGWNAGGHRDVSLVDCVSFALMHELHLSHALALDRHFVERGFTVLP